MIAMQSEVERTEHASWPVLRVGDEMPVGVQHCRIFLSFDRQVVAVTLVCHQRRFQTKARNMKRQSQACTAKQLPCLCLLDPLRTVADLMGVSGFRQAECTTSTLKARTICAHSLAHSQFAAWEDDSIQSPPVLRSPTRLGYQRSSHLSVTKQ
jgi:hypothetical protein